MALTNDLTACPAPPQDERLAGLFDEIINHEGFIANQVGFDPDCLIQLVNGEGIDSIVVSTYFQLLNRRQRPEGCPQLKALPVVIFDEALAQDHRGFLYSLGDDVDIFTGTVLIPVYCSARRHFTLIVLDNDARTITLYDPYGLLFIELLQSCMIYVVEKEPSGGDCYTSNRREDIPRQNNQLDCGVFIMAYADRIANGIMDMDFTAEDIKELRIEYAIFLLNSDVNEKAEADK